MKRFVEGVDRAQGSMFPERLDDWIGEDNPVRVIDVFVGELDLRGLGFDRAEPEEVVDQRLAKSLVEIAGFSAAASHAVSVKEVELWVWR